MTDIATLGIKIDATDVDGAITKLDAFTAAAGRAEASAASIKTPAASMRDMDAAASVSGQGLTATSKALGEVSAASTAMGASVGAATAKLNALTASAIKAHESQSALAVSMRAMGGSAMVSVDAMTRTEAALNRTKVSVENLGVAATSGLPASRRAMMDVAGAADIMATRQAEALKTVASEAHVSSRAVNETLVLTRELSRGNFTRMAGSATILAQSLQSTNSSMLDLFRSLGLMLGLIERVPPAMAAATASEVMLNGAAVLVMKSEADKAASALASARVRVAAAEKVFAANEGVARSERDQLKAAVALIAANEELAGAATAAAIAEERLAIATNNAAQAAGSAAISAEANATATGVSAEAAGASATAAGAEGAVAMTALGAAAAVVGAVVATLGIGFVSAFATMKASAGDLTEGMGLTQKQMQRLKDDGVSTSLTIGDAWKGLGATIKEYFGGAMDTVGSYALKVAKVIADALGFIVASTVGIIYSIYNSAKVVLQDTINFAIAGLNALAALSDRIDGTKNGKRMAYADFGAIADPRDAFMKGFNGTKSFGEDWQKNSEKAGQKRIEDRDGDPGKTPKAKKATDQVKTEENFLESLNQETATMGLNKVERKMHEVNDRANEAAKSGFPALAASIREAGKAWEAAFSAHAVDDLVKKIEDQNAAQTFANSLLKMNVKEQEIANAEHAYELELLALKREGIILNATEMARLNAAHAASVELAKQDGQRKLDVQNVKDYAAAMKDIATAAKELNDGIRNSVRDFSNLFGAVGKGVENLVNVMTKYADQQVELQAKMAAAKAAGAKGEAQYAALQRQSAMAEISNYGNMLGAAKSFFGQKTTAYKALENAERVYRLFEFAMHAKSMALKAVEFVTHMFQKTTMAGASVAAETTATAAAVAGAAVRTPVKVAEGAATMFATLGPLGFVAVAAMVALLASLGFSGGGGASGATSTATGLDTSNITSSAYNSPYSTQAGSNGLYNPAAAAAPTTQNYGQSSSTVVAPTYNITAPGADAGTVQQIQTMLDNHTQTVVAQAVQASAINQAQLAARQRIGGA